MKTKRVYHRKKGIEERRDGKSFMGIFISQDVLRRRLILQNTSNSRKQETLQTSNSSNRNDV
jgi:hypothetical protein